ncbi:MAG: metallophosphoesterase family protein [Candidatus Latescibacteria bacterium]|nr:metallophosphoesterase family protein [Candidatus Latescibacterota bacterium]
MHENLRCREDGTFIIAQFTDMHIKGEEEADANTYAACDTVLTADEPDFVILTGDIVHTRENVDGHWRRVVDYFDNTGVPWTFVYGNHDPECYPKDDIDAVLATSFSCLFEPGPKDIWGSGSYVLQVYSCDGSKIVAMIWSIDSGSSGNGPLQTGYDWIKEDQVAWFSSEADTLAVDYIEQLTGLFFVHITLPQYRTVWDKEACTGYKYEDVCEQGKDTGLFDELKTNDRVQAVFVGHEHINDYIGTLDGVDLCYGRGTGYGAYGKDGFQRGGRIIRVTQGVRGYDTYCRLADGSVADTPVHLPGSSEFSE